MDNEYLTLSEHREFSKRIEEENDRQNHRLTNLENAVQQIAGLASAVEKLAVNMEHMAKEQQRQGDRLGILEGRDGEKWRNVVSHVLLGIITALIGYLLRDIGL
jgi:hypothetical protein